MTLCFVYLAFCQKFWSPAKISLPNAGNWPEYKNGQNKIELGWNMFLYGFFELISRILQIFFASKIPERKFATIYSIFTILTGVCLLFLLVPHVLTRVLFFCLFPLMTGPLNGLLFGASQDIFGARKINRIWPTVNLFLALGFALGPVLASFLPEKVDRILCFFLLMVAAFLMAVTQKQIIPKHESEKKNEVKGQAINLERMSTNSINVVYQMDILQNETSTSC